MITRTQGLGRVLLRTATRTVTTVTTPVPPRPLPPTAPTPPRQPPPRPPLVRQPKFSGKQKLAVAAAVVGGGVALWWMSQSSDGEGCPDIPLHSAEDWADEMLQAEKSDSVIAESKGPYHHYRYVTRAGNVKELAAALEMSADELTALLVQPLFWQTLWASSVPGRGHLEKALAVSADGIVGNFGLTSGRDQVAVTPLGIKVTELGIVVSFQAKTRKHHSLRGTVQHNLIVRKDGTVFFAWEGAGGGDYAPGVVNNRLALGRRFGMWPNVAGNARVLLADKQVMKSLAKFARSPLPAYLVEAQERAALLETATSKMVDMLSKMGEPARSLNESLDPDHAVE